MLHFVLNLVFEKLQKMFRFKSEKLHIDNMSGK